MVRSSYLNYFYCYLCLIPPQQLFFSIKNKSSLLGSWARANSEQSIRMVFPKTSKLKTSNLMNCFVFLLSCWTIGRSFQTTCPCTCLFLPVMLPLIRPSTTLRYVFALNPSYSWILFTTISICLKVLAKLDAYGFKGYSKPIATYQEADCLYEAQVRANKIQKNAEKEVCN